MAAVRGSAAAIARHEIWVVSLGIVAGVYSARFYPVALVIAALFWGVRWLAAGRLTVRTPGDWAIGLLLLTLPVTLWATALPDVTRPQAWQVLAGVALYYAVANWAAGAAWAANAARLRWLMLGVIGLGLLLAVLAPFTVAWFTSAKLTFIPAGIYDRLPRLLADPIHPNIMAGALVVLLPLALALPLFAWRQLRWYERMTTGLAALAMVSVLILTKSRGGLLALAAILALLVALRWRRGWLVVSGGVLAVVLGIWRLGGNRVLETLAATQSIGGMDGRLEVWSRALYMLQDFPFSGIGMGTFKQVANAMYPFFLAGPDAEIPHAHNLFLQVGVDLGLPGLVAWLALFLLVCVAAWRVYRWGQAEDKLEEGTAGKRHADRCIMAGLGAGLLASQVALLMHGLLDAATWGTRPAVLVWALWGLAMAARNRLAADDG